MRNTLLALLIGGIGLPALAATPSYRVDIIPGTRGIAINASGAVAGWIEDSEYTRRATLALNGQLTQLGTLGGQMSASNDINDLNQIVGSSTLDRQGTTHAFLYTNGAMKDLGTLGGNSSAATAINNAGVIAGDATLANGEQRAFTYSEAGGMRDIGTLGGNWSSGRAINAKGDVLGTSTTANGEEHSFLYSNGVMTDLNNLAGWNRNMLATGFGENGEIFGTAPDIHSGYSNGYVWKNGNSSQVPEMSIIIGIDRAGRVYGTGPLDDIVRNPDGSSDTISNLVPAGWSLHSLWDVNQNGQGVAVGCKAGECYSVIMTPVPEPETYAMLLAGFAAIGWRARRRARPQA